MKTNIVMGSSWKTKDAIYNTGRHLLKNEANKVIGFRLMRADWSKYIRGYQRRIKGGSWIDSISVLRVDNKRAPRHNHDRGTYGFRLMKLERNKNG
jgi:hypothetical protein